MEAVSSTQIGQSLRYLDGIDRTRVTLGNSADDSAFEFENLLSAGEQDSVEDAVRNVNRGLQIDGRQIKQTMDKDDYLKLLIAQLQNQDPTNPMQDREFIAQMAQFSSLEQMTNMASGFQTMAGMLQSGQAAGMLGRDVEIIVSGNVVEGTVEEVTRGDYPQVLVNGSYYSIDDVSKVREITAVAASAAAAQSEQE
jgi:flagellar basal-body rod modification protein FlgD